MYPKTKEFRVEGMSCGHCEMAVNKSLMAIDGVTSAKADHQAGKVLVELNREVDEALLEQAIIKAGYTVPGRV
jgi:copper chaperone CopZ